jgi:hypothetical protein
MWQEGDAVLFRSTAQERGVLVIDEGKVSLAAPR